MEVTPTGIPVTFCHACNRKHPVTRKHCGICGIASLFIASDGNCWACVAAAAEEASTQKRKEETE